MMVMQVTVICIFTSSPTLFILQLRLLNFIKVRSDNHNKGGRHGPFAQQLTNELRAKHSEYMVAGIRQEMGENKG